MCARQSLTNGLSKSDRQALHLQPPVIVVKHPHQHGTMASSQPQHVSSAVLTTAARLLLYPAVLSTLFAPHRGRCIPLQVACDCDCNCISHAAHDAMSTHGRQQCLHTAEHTNASHADPGQRLLALGPGNGMHTSRGDHTRIPRNGTHQCSDATANQSHHRSHTPEHNTSHTHMHLNASERHLEPRLREPTCSLPTPQLCNTQLHHPSGPC